MFYSHEVLTSRRYGVATIWLVATLGSKSSLKKISRKSVQNVDIAGACSAIVIPQAPMALRLQSNLLYGVTRVFALQCDYTLNDVELMQTNIRLLVKSVKEDSLASRISHRGRAEQLLLPDATDFSLDFNFIQDHSMLLEHPQTNKPETLQLPILSPQSQHSVRSRSQARANSTDVGFLDFPDSSSSVQVFGPMTEANQDFNLTGYDETPFVLEEDLGLDFQENATPPGVINPEWRGQPLEEPIAQPNLQEESFQDEKNYHLPAQNDAMLQSQNYNEVELSLHDPSYGGIHSEIEVPFFPRGAPMQRTRRAVATQISYDTITEVRNADLARWSNEYLRIMTESNRHKFVAKSLAQAKRNAICWMLGTPLGFAQQPLSQFSGMELLHRLADQTLHRSKRTHEQIDFLHETERRVRRRHSDEVDAENARRLDDDPGPMLEYDTIELAREAHTPLDDRPGSSVMPWNFSGSSRNFVFHPDLISSASLPRPGFYPSGNRGRHDHTILVSPLVRIPMHGKHPSDASIRSAGGSNDVDLVDDLLNSVQSKRTDSDLVPRTQFNNESLLFLDFIRNRIAEIQLIDARPSSTAENYVEVSGGISFEQLLPYTQGRHVAAQALLHVLALATAGTVSAHQSEAFGPIFLNIF